MCTKVNIKYITDLNIKLKTIDLFKNIEENLCGFELGKDLLESTKVKP